jgi:hypothetical protein
MKAIDTFDAILANEAQTMGRPVHGREFFQRAVVVEASGHSIDFRLVIYDCDPIQVPGGRAMTETRYAVYMDGRGRGGGVIDR